MGRPRKNPIVEPPKQESKTLEVDDNNTKTQEFDINTLAPTQLSESSIDIPKKDVKKRGRKKLEPSNNEVQQITESMDKLVLENKPEEPEKKKRILKKNKKTTVESEEVENKLIQQNVHELMNDINNINLNDFIVDNNINKNISENKLNDDKEENNYDNKLNQIDKELDNLKEIKPKYIQGDNIDLLNIQETLYFYIYLSNMDIYENLKEEYLPTKKFILGFSTYPRINSYSYFMNNNKDEWEYDNEFKYSIEEYPNLDLRIRLVKTKPIKEDIESDKWNIHLIEYQRTKTKMSKKEILEKVLTKNTWQYYIEKEQINLVIERTLSTDNSYFLNNNLKCMIDNKYYYLNLTYRNMIEFIVNNME